MLDVTTAPFNLYLLYQGACTTGNSLKQSGCEAQARVVGYDSPTRERIKGGRREATLAFAQPRLLYEKKEVCEIHYAISSSYFYTR